MRLGPALILHVSSEELRDHPKSPGYRRRQEMTPTDRL